MDRPYISIEKTLSAALEAACFEAVIASAPTSQRWGYDTLPSPPPVVTVVVGSSEGSGLFFPPGNSVKTTLR